MGRRLLLATAGWLAAAVLATLIGVAAIRLVGESITGTPGGVRSQADIERALAAPEPTPVTAAPPNGTAGPVVPASPGASPAGPTPTALGPRRSFVTVGGTAVAECVGGGDVRLVSWAPAQDYRVQDVDRGPDDDAEVTFAGPAGQFEVRVACIGGEPVARPDDD